MNVHQNLNEPSHFSIKLEANRDSMMDSGVPITEEGLLETEHLQTVLLGQTAPQTAPSILSQYTRHGHLHPNVYPGAITGPAPPIRWNAAHAHYAQHSHGIFDVQYRAPQLRQQFRPDLLPNAQYHEEIGQNQQDFGTNQIMHHLYQQVLEERDQAREYYHILQQQHHSLAAHYQDLQRQFEWASPERLYLHDLNEGLRMQYNALYQKHTALQEKALHLEGCNVMLEFEKCAMQTMTLKTPNPPYWQESEAAVKREETLRWMRKTQEQKPAEDEETSLSIKRGLGNDEGANGGKCMEEVEDGEEDVKVTNVTNMLNYLSHTTTEEQLLQWGDKETAAGFTVRD